MAMGPKKILSVLNAEFQKIPRHAMPNAPRDCRRCFDVKNLSASAYCTDLIHPKTSSDDCLDCDYGSDIHSCYESFNIRACENCHFMLSSMNCSDSEYCIDLYNCTDCFGCIYLQNRQYCILNRQLTRDEYLLALKKIKGELKEKNIYGKSLAEILLS